MLGCLFNSIPSFCQKLRFSTFTHGSSIQAIVLSLVKMWWKLWTSQFRVLGPVPSLVLDLCVSSLRRGHANFLCIVPILSHVSEETSVWFLRNLMGGLESCWEWNIFHCGFLNLIYFSQCTQGTPGIKNEGDLSTNGTCAIFHYLRFWGEHFENTRLLREWKRKKEYQGQIDCGKLGL